jgi:hypothetical protein
LAYLLAADRAAVSAQQRGRVEHRRRLQQRWRRIKRRQRHKRFVHEFVDERLGSDDW